jgi:hypothetical protein
MAEVVNDRIQRMKHVRETLTIIAFNAYDVPNPAPRNSVFARKPVHAQRC